MMYIYIYTWLHRVLALTNLSSNSVLDSDSAKFGWLISSDIFRFEIA